MSDKPEPIATNLDAIFKRIEKIRGRQPVLIGEDHSYGQEPPQSEIVAKPPDPIEKKPLKKINRVQKKIIDAAVNIMETPETPSQEKAFLARQLVQVTLPHSNPGNVPAWKRTNGNLTLLVRSGWDDKKDQPIGFPYGTLPRLLLFWITTEALRTKSRRLELGNSLASFMRELGLDAGRGGKRSDAYRLHNQMERLFRATISFIQREEIEGRHSKSWVDMQVAPKGKFWWDICDPEKPMLWGSWIELGEDFYNAIISSPVPVDMRALRALSKSPMALDLYAWATWRSFTVSKKSEQQFIPWSGLAQQLGADYGNLDDFRRKFKAALRKVKAVYSTLKIEDIDGGVIVLPNSAPAVRHRSKKPKALPPPTTPHSALTT